MFLDYIINFVKINYIDFHSRLVNLHLNIILEFILANRFILLFLLVTYLGILLDSRFKLTRKIWILFFILILLFILILYDYNDLNIFFRELYWYTLIINSCFIIHMLYLHWIFLYFWKQRQENICWYVSLLGFIFSLSFLVFLLLYIYLFYLDRYRLQKYNSWTISLFLDSILVSAIVLRFFIFVFANYSCLVIGSSNWIKLNLKKILIFSLFFLFTLIMSYYILGISRIFFVWFLIFLGYSYQIFSNYAKKFDQSKTNYSLYWCFLSLDFQKIIAGHIDKPSYYCLIATDALYIKNFKELYYIRYLSYIYIQLFNREEFLTIKKVLFDYINTNWYSRALIELTDINNLDSQLDLEVVLAEKIIYLKDKYNLSESEIEQLKSDYRKYCISGSLSTKVNVKFNNYIFDLMKKIIEIFSK